ncbi:MAG: SUMF1/EgtB/PvdO family nonheme iron enzyme [Planctomycetaceae bacterium]|nr:SUMF1/EgtB/PvdO family nonheme iron enzyme [Planctomycetaceae bacterium]
MPKKLALLVGVNKYERRGFADLSYAQRDVEELGAELRRLGFETTVLTGDAEGELRATRSNIDEHVQKLLQDVHKQDIVLLMFSGHGQQFDMKRDDGSTKNDAFYCPVDAVMGEPESLVSLSLLIDDVLARKGGRNLVLVDACRDLPKDASRGIKGVQGRSISLPEETAVFFSCRQGQQSYENQNAGGGHGVFTHCVLEGLRGKASINDAVTWSSLVNFVENSMVTEEVRRFLPEGRRQEPLLAGNVGRVVLAKVPSIRRRPGGTIPPKAVAPFDEIQARKLQEAWADYLETDVEVRNSIGMRLTLIPPGEFQMGSHETAKETAAFTVRTSIPDSEAGNFESEHPQHLVELTKPFLMGSVEVTKGEFRQFVEAEKYQTEAEANGKGGWGYALGKFEARREYNWRKTGFEQTGDHPVVNVTWNDAVRFCKWLSEKEGKTYRLPTEAQWEYACRAGTTGRYYTGNAPEDLKGSANVRDLISQRIRGMNQSYGFFEFEDGTPFTAAVGNYRKNPFGLYDMHGNAMEWCSDWFDEQYYGRSPKENPEGPDIDQSLRVMRGGSWDLTPTFTRSAFRFGVNPDLAHYSFGFRVIQILDQEKIAPPAQVAEEPPQSDNRLPAPLVAPFSVSQAKDGQSAWAEYLGTEVESENSIGMKFTLIPSGEFQMGNHESPAESASFALKTGEKQSSPSNFADEHPQHRVKLTKPFLLGTREVTRGQFREFVESTGYLTEAETDGKGGWGHDGKKFEIKPLYNWKNTGFEQTDEHPVVNVTWNDAAKFCKWLSDSEGFGANYQLPTEAQWEYACRGGTVSRYYTGDSPDDLKGWENVGDQSKRRIPGIPDVSIFPFDDGYQFTSVTGSYRKNPFGLFDMHGNVVEWCSDWYDPNFYGGSPLEDPAGQMKEQTYRVIRGGHWSGGPTFVRSADRFNNIPEERFDFIGFRVARLLDEELKVAATLRSSNQNTSIMITEPLEPAVEPPLMAIAPFNTDQARQYQKTWANHLKTDEEITNSIGMKLKLIPPGEFVMGSHESPDETETFARLTGEGWTLADGLKNEHPQHQVRLTRAFYLGMHEVTRGEFRNFVESESYRTEAETDGSGGLGNDGFESRQKPEYNWKNTGSGFGQTDVHPVVNVSWNDAVKFCEWLSRKEGDKYRLPTEAEWEYACRAGTKGRYASGNEPEELAKIGNIADATLRQKYSARKLFETAIKSEDGYAFTAPVGSFLPNAFGLSDMHGNVWELCLDWYDKSYYLSSPVVNPLGPSSGSDRVLRGGSWSDGPVFCRSASRLDFQPWHRNFNQGFRVVRVIPEVENAALVAEEVSEKPKRPIGEKPPLIVAPFDASQAKESQQAWAKHLGSEVQITNSLGMKMNLIPPAEFHMGSEKPGADPDESPIHKVRLTKPFYLGQMEVKQREWYQLMNTTPWKVDEFLEYIREGEDFPATFVSYDDAEQFCLKLSGKEGKTYRLPTEAEWEYACRAGTRSVYFFANDESGLSEHAWYVRNALDGGEKYAHRVGLKQPNGFGLYDMHGNVSEWCRDWYGENYYREAPLDNPSGPASGELRILRGGSWGSEPLNCRSSSRGRDRSSARHVIMGFRVVHEP